MSVRSLWRSSPTEYKEPKTPFDLRWISGQILAIVEALAYIHDEYAEDLPDNLKGPNKEMYGRHGDIKAGNFLVYPNRSVTKGDLIFLADFGLSRFHRQKTRSMEPPRAASPPYRPPEFDTTKALSRKSDIWSLGAFFLEFFTWYLRGWEGVHTEFPELRKTRDHQNLESDIFFTITTVNRVQTATVKKEVHNWISYLRSDRRATPFVHDVLDLVEQRMLVVEPSLRISAVDLKKELSGLNEKSKKRKGYLKPSRQYADSGRSV